MRKQIRIRHDGNGIWKVGAYSARPALRRNPHSMKKGLIIVVSVIATWDLYGIIQNPSGT
ncbi:hypothetical protein [Nitrososphaera sp. AFS]|uniref:hypothetical protein n=1 Tax=Nitrososphaera sp. AFS TaxID=2301191 RepID=UPI0013923502|nr:hypothetical protein [Nitrososphaera sp. AFS]